MKKIVVILLMFIVTMFSFAKGNYVPHIDKNPEIVFTAQTKNSDKIVTVYREGEHLIYTFGKEGKSEIEIVGVPERNLFKNFGDWGGNAMGHFLVFKNMDFTYVISYFDSEKPLYRLEVYKDKNHKPLYSKELENNTVTNKIIADSTYYDSLSEDPEYDEYYMNW